MKLKEKLFPGILCGVAAICFMLFTIEVFLAVIENQLEWSFFRVGVFLVLLWLVYLFSSVTFRIFIWPESGYFVDVYSLSIIGFVLIGFGGLAIYLMLSELQGDGSLVIIGKIVVSILAFRVFGWLGCQALSRVHFRIKVIRKKANEYVLRKRPQ